MYNDVFIRNIERIEPDVFEFTIHSSLLNDYLNDCEYSNLFYNIDEYLNSEGIDGEVFKDGNWFLKIVFIDKSNVYNSELWEDVKQWCIDEINCLTESIRDLYKEYFEISNKKEAGDIYTVMVDWNTAPIEIKQYNEINELIQPFKEMKDILLNNDDFLDYCCHMELLEVVGMNDYKIKRVA
jgi:hypothetical protein